MIIQKDKGFFDFVRKLHKDSVYSCYYCNDTINMEELLIVEDKFKRMDPEDHEFLLDNLPNSDHPRKPPFIHKSDLGYDVLNICIKCFKRAKNV